MMQIMHFSKKKKIVALVDSFKKFFFFYPEKAKREINYVIKVLSSISKVFEVVYNRGCRLTNSFSSAPPPPLSLVRTTHCSRHRLTIRHAHTKYLELCVRGTLSFCNISP
jgi:hypothetical protein